MIIGLEVPKNRNKTHLKENDAEMVHIIDLQFIKIIMLFSSSNTSSSDTSNHKKG